MIHAQVTLYKPDEQNRHGQKKEKEETLPCRHRRQGTGPRARRLASRRKDRDREKEEAREAQADSRKADRGSLKSQVVLVRRHPERSRFSGEAKDLTRDKS